MEPLECTASGVPPPNIVWYIDDPTNRIDSSLSTQREETDGAFDVKIVSTLNRLPLEKTG